MKRLPGRLFRLVVMPSTLFLLMFWIWDSSFPVIDYTTDVWRAGAWVPGAMAAFYWLLAFGMELIGVYER